MNCSHAIYRYEISIGKLVVEREKEPLDINGLDKDANIVNKLRKHDESWLRDQLQRVIL